MAATATITGPGTGRADGATDLTTTASENTLTVSGVTEVWARISGAGLFGTGSADADLVPMDADTWTLVYRRSTRAGRQSDVLYFKLNSGTGALYYSAHD